MILEQQHYLVNADRERAVHEAVRKNDGPTKMSNDERDLMHNVVGNRFFHDTTHRKQKLISH